jgi:hypothetical protein
MANRLDGRPARKFHQDMDWSNPQAIARSLVSDALKKVNTRNAANERAAANEQMRRDAAKKDSRAVHQVDNSDDDEDEVEPDSEPNEVGFYEEDVLELAVEIED